MKRADTFRQYILRYWQIVLLISITISIFLIPNLFWGNLYQVGGDDGRFYYIFPWEYLKNFSFNIISNNTLGGNMGYLPVSYSAPTIFVLYILKTLFPAFNTQLLAYGLILSISFLFMYLFLHEVIASKSVYLYWGRLLTSIYYIFSVYLTKTFYQHQLISMYSIMVLPVCLYLFTVGVKKMSYKYIIASSLFYSIFSSTLYGLPWLLPSVITLIPFLIYLQNHNRSMFIKALFIFVIFTVLCNMYWIIHYVVPFITKSGGDVFTDHLLSDTYREQNNDAIAAITRLNAPVNQLINHLRTSWMDRESVTLHETIGVVYFLVALYAGSLLRLVRRSSQILFLTVFTGFCLTLFFVTPNFGEMNLKIFQFLNNTIPFFVMFRNMYDKFALATAFQYAFMVYITLYIFGEARMNNICKYFILLTLCIVTGIKMYPYVFVQYSDDIYSTRISGRLNTDFFSLMSYVGQMDTTSRFLWYPMTYPGYIFIRDAVGTHNFYTGLSPMQILAKKSDIAGYYGIQTQSKPDLNAVIYDSLKRHEYEIIGKRLQEQNIGFIIENKDIPDTLALKFLDENGFMSSQSSEYFHEIKGDKIKDFGTSYSLYAIQKKYLSQTVSMADSVQLDSVNTQQVKFKKLQNGSYDMYIDRLKDSKYLIFLEPYNPLWNIRLVDGNRKKTISIRPARAFDYGNVWKLDSKELLSRYPDMLKKNSDGTISMHAEIIFSPAKYSLPFLSMSILTGLIGLLIIFL